MIRLGRTYGNRMIEVSAMNSKLADRAVRMVSDITGTALSVARPAVEAAGWHVKSAVLMIEKGLDAPTARALLQAHDDRLDAALAAGRSAGEARGA
jgi:N-acetylmuramic acid 6-phosphate etherase